MGLMRFHSKVVPAKAVFASLMACLGAGCAVAPARSWSVNGLFGGAEEAARYGDFITARYAAVSDDPVAAAKYARRAQAGEPKDAALLERAVVASLLAGEADEAATLAKGTDDATLKQAPFASLMRIANDIALGRNKPALQRLNQGGLGAVNVEATHFLSAWLAAPADVDAALTRFAPPGARGVAANGEAVSGLILLARNRPVDAQVHLEQAWKRGDHTPAAVAALIPLVAASDPDRAQKIIAAYRNEAGYDPLVEAAAASPSRASDKLSTREGVASALAMLGHGILVRANPELATLYFSLALHVYPDLDAARIDLADSLREQGRGAAAIKVLAGVGSNSIYRPQASMTEAFLREDLGDHEEARAAASAALAKSRPRDMLVQAGDLNRSQNRHADAEALYDEALKLDAANSRADWRLYFARAAERDRLGRWQDAEADIRRALELEPERPELLNFLGFSLVQRGGDVRGGLDLIEKAAARRPDQGYIVDSLGWAHYRLGDFAEAVTQLERAAELSPSDPEIIDHLGDAYWRHGQQQDADYSWRRALQLKPAAELADSLKQKLQGGLADQPRPRAVAGAPEPSRP
jgi:Flp pilus assembly protein TadD